MRKGIHLGPRPAALPGPPSLGADPHCRPPLRTTDPVLSALRANEANALPTLITGAGFAPVKDPRVAQLKTRAVGKTEPAPSAPSLEQIRAALGAADARFLAMHPKTGDEELFEHPWDAFFNVKNLTSTGESWRDLFAKIDLDQAALDKSLEHPVTLAPLNIALFQGKLFPDAYFVRNTLYFNEMRDCFQHVGSYDMSKMSSGMPYIELREDRRPELHAKGGTQQLLDMLTAQSQDGVHVVAYRGCSRAELDLQRLICDLLDGDPQASLRPEERARYEAILTDNDNTLTDALAYAEPLARDKPRAEVAEALASVLGGRNAATFVGFDPSKAKEFIDPNAVAPSGASDDVVARYEIPISVLTEHAERGTLYVGTEFSALEAGFGEARGAGGQDTKIALYRALAGELER